MSSPKTDVETIATGRNIRERPRLRRLYGKGRWRKMKGSARIRLKDGRIRRVVDESGEDDLFSADRFVAIDLAAAVKASLLKAS